MPSGVIHHVKHTSCETLGLTGTHFSHNISVTALASADRFRSSWLPWSSTVASLQPQASLENPSIITLEGIAARVR
jgi:hypothetical protein